jgi:hypothetical protein
MSVYLALHTSAGPVVGDIAEFGRMALLLGATADQMLAANPAQNGALTVVLPIPDDVKL